MYAAASVVIGVASFLKQAAWFCYVNKNVYLFLFDNLKPDCQ